MIPTEREIDQIAEYADASVRGVTRRGLARADQGPPRQRDLHVHRRGC